MSDWRRQLKGAFAFQTAPFAVHPNDERRALAAIAEAIRAGASKKEIELEIQKYLSNSSSHEFIIYQIKLFQSFFAKQYKVIRNCWVFSKPRLDRPEFVAIFSGRISIDTVVHHCMHIYQSREFNEATQFMRAKKKRWPSFQVQYHKYDSGTHWPGRVTIGDDPSYLIERADATLSKGLDPKSTIVWQAKPILNDPGKP